MSEEEPLQSVWEHLDELRKTLIQIFFMVALGIGVTLFFYQPLFKLIESSFQPSSAVKKRLQYERMENPLAEEISFYLPEGAKILSPSEYYERVSNIQLKIKGGKFVDYELSLEPRLRVLNPLEGILITFKLAFWIGLVLSAPFWGYALLKFVLPGLREGEKRFIFPFFLGSLVSLTFGIIMGYKVTLPLSNRYLESFNSVIGENAWALSHYVDYSFVLILGHAIAFELCLILFFLVHTGVLNASWLIGKRRVMIVVAFVLGALLTPPDVLTQVALALPLMGIYELTIFYAKVRNFYLTRT
jgi:sec-independent protein translocase protein TatC